MAEDKHTPQTITSATSVCTTTPESTSIPPKPEKPLPSDCCDTGCDVCVFDLYYDALEEWQKRYGELVTKEDG